jgi:hypothetical protein
MAFLMEKSRSFLAFGRSTGKHAARRGIASTTPRQDDQRPKARRVSHAASTPRLTSSHSDQGKAA